MEKGQMGQKKQDGAGYCVSIYRVSLVKDESMEFEQVAIYHSQDAQHLFRNLIKTKGQTDREQFCIALLDSKNKVIGLNMVSMGDLERTIVSPREILKAAILAGASGIILSHNHPSGELSPSPNDREITKRMVLAGKIMGIRVLDHLIINMEEDRFFSFADDGLMDRLREEARRIEQGW